jgi:predicted metal-dependent phosphoesterase TrpH
MNELLRPILERTTRGERARGPAGRPCPGARIDLHCHSTFSYETLRGLPGLVYHPLCTPEEVYDLAKARGMDFVTLTDHNTLAGCLHLLEQRGPQPDFIFGEEVSARFPQDGTVVHMNVFDHDEPQHREIQRLRQNIYELVAYLRQIDKLYVLNHMTWTGQHRVLTPWQLDALLELFDLFEGLNGARSYPHNAFAWHVTCEHQKILVAGSDSHTNRVGTTYTVSVGDTKAELLRNIRAGHTACCGAFGTPEKLREDVRMVLQKNVERRLAEESSRWRRLACHAVRGVGKALYPLVCLGYHMHQALLIRGFADALPV